MRPAQSSSICCSGRVRKIAAITPATSPAITQGQPEPVKIPRASPVIRPVSTHMPLAMARSCFGAGLWEPGSLREATRPMVGARMSLSTVE